MALALGRFVSEIDRGMSHAELVDWMAFYQIEPFGEQRDDMRAAQLTAAVLAPHSRKQQKAADFMLFPEHEQGPVLSEDDKLDLILDRAARRAKGD